MVWASDQNAQRAPCFEGFLGMSNWEETRGRATTLWRDYRSYLAEERLVIPQEELENVAGERDVCCHHDPTPKRQKNKDGWINQLDYDGPPQSG